MAPVLQGFRVIDFGQYIAGPLTGMLLADQGADVVKVEPPGGPRWDTPANAAWNRGKRGITLDLKEPSGLATARELVAGADALVENFRPGVMDRLGLGADAACAGNAGLIYCSLPGFAADDPRAGVRAFEGVVGAATATYRLHPPGDADRPVYTAIPIASAYAAFQAAIAIVMAARARERDGIGQRIEVPLFDAMFPAIGYSGLRVHNAPPARERTAGIWAGNFTGSDGQWVRFGGPFNQNFKQFVQAAGIGDWPPALLDYAAIARDPELQQEQERRARELFGTRTAQEWEDLISAAGSEGGRLRSSAEWLAEPQARASEMAIELDDPRFGGMVQPGINARLSLTPGVVRGPAPLPDQHRAEILAELPAERDRRRGRPAVSPEETVRAALAGVKVLDLCIILAGPTMGRTLAEYGASVIKIDAPNRGAEVTGRLEVTNHTEINRGKRHMLLDLKCAEGAEIFWRLVDDADVIVQNFRAGKLAKLGLGYDDIRKRRPDIIYASTNAYGHAGPWAGRPGHESFIQTVTGMAERFGGDGSSVQQPYAINDYGTGFMGAYGIALALLHRRRTGEGQHVDTSLAYTSMTLQSPFMLDYAGKQWTEPRGQRSPGTGPLTRAYRAADCWLFIGARAADLPRLAAVAGLEGVERLSGTKLEAALEERFAGEPAAGWIVRLNAAGIGAHRVVMQVEELMADPWVIGHGLSITREFDELGPVTACGPAPRLSRTPVVPGAPPPKPGKHARAILEEIGWGDRFEQLLAAGVIRTDGVRAG